MRLDWEEYALELARVASLRSEDPFMKVGACVLRHDNSVAGLGYNGAPPGIEINWENRDERRKRVIHAEANAIGYAARNGIATDGCIMYCTMTPCIACAKLVTAAGIKEFYYIERYRLDDGIKFLEQSHVRIQKVLNGTKRKSFR